MEKLKELQDLAIWMSGCGYDFTQHEHFLKNKHLLTDEAINYTHSCKSDSELLKDKPKLNFEDWYITYGYAKSVTGNFVKEGVRYTADEMQFKYEYNMP